MYRRLLSSAALVAVMVTLTACPTGTTGPSNKTKISTGSNVTVQLSNPKLTKPVKLTLGAVTQEGEVTLDTVDNPPQLPTGATLTLGTVFDVSTTAKFDKATLCFEDPAITAKSKLLHFSDNKWNDRTSNVNPPQICGDFTSFSPVAVVDQAAATPTPTASPTAAATATASPTAAATATPAATPTATATVAATPTPTQAQQQTEAPTQAPTQAPVTTTAPPTQAPTPPPTTAPPTPSPTPAFNAIPRPAVPTKLGIWGRVTGPDGSGVGGACVTLGPPIRCFTFTSNSLNAADTGYFAIDLDALAAPSGSQWDFYVVTGGAYTKVAFAQYYSGKFVVAGVVQKDVKLQ